jgi:hypothetical protein
MDTSHRRGIDAIVRLLGSNEPNEADPVSVVDRHNQTVLVAFDGEHHAVLADDARVRMDEFDVWRRPPIGHSRIVIPGSQRLFGIGMTLPTLSKRATSNDPH